MTLTLTLLVLSQVQVNIPLPPIIFPAPPPLVVVEPGIQVVPDLDDEVFVVDSWYWTQRDGRWFKSRDHKGGWVVVDAPLVPPLIVKQPRGKYKRWKAIAKQERREDRAERREDREERREDRAERREDKQERKEDRKENKGHGKGRK